MSQKYKTAHDSDCSNGVHMQNELNVSDGYLESININGLDGLFFIWLHFPALMVRINLTVVCVCVYLKRMRGKELEHIVNYSLEGLTPNGRQRLAREKCKIMGISPSFPPP